MSSEPRDGWAARRADRCEDSETGHPTWGNMWVCCPSGMSFSTEEDNNTRCNTGKSLAEFPNQCADPSLILFSNGDAFFCCASGLVGFSNKNAYLGCATSDEVVKGKSEGTMKGAIQRGQPAVSATSTTTSATTSAITSAATSTISQASISTTTSVPSSTSEVLESSSIAGGSESSGSQGSSTNTGAIVGGAVGGVCGALLIVGVIWFFMRRRRASRASQPQHFIASSNPPLSSEPKGYYNPQGDHIHGSAELYDNSMPPELQGSTQPRHELPGYKSGAKQQSPFELY